MNASEHEETIPVEENKPNLRTIDATIKALNGLPIIEQLNFVEGLLMLSGGCRESSGQNPVLITATEAVRSVMSILKRHPQAASLKLID